jgi:hypothetical protein
VKRGQGRAIERGGEVIPLVVRDRHRDPALAHDHEELVGGAVGKELERVLAGRGAFVRLAEHGLHAGVGQ